MFAGQDIGAEGTGKEQSVLKGGSWLEAPWKLAPEAAAALAKPLTFGSMSYIFLEVTPVMLVNPVAIVHLNAAHCLQLQTVQYRLGGSWSVSQNLPVTSNPQNSGSRIP
jgi:hypothetical protein